MNYKENGCTVELKAVELKTVEHVAFEIVALLKLSHSWAQNCQNYHTVL